MALVIYLDESGDLGWNFALPYRKGGSSRHLTIGSLCIPPAKEYLVRRVVRDLYTKFKWKPSKEKKWVDMPDSAREEFADSARVLCDSEPDIHLHAITVRKENVMEHIKSDSNKLYNYMIRLSLLDRMALHDDVTLCPDVRSIKVQSGNSLHDYLQLELWFTKKVKTKLKNNPRHSSGCLEIQFTDMLCGVVQSFHEDNDQKNLTRLGPRIRQCRLFFK